MSKVLAREERYGLGIAAAAHVALVLLLIWHANREPAMIPPPERMVVSFADEVALADTAPNPSEETQAAIAPTLSDTPEPAPVTEPVEQAQPTPPRPAPRAATPPREQPRPQPTPTRQSSGSRIGNDFLEGNSTGQRSENAGTPAREMGPRERASLQSAINRQLRPNWRAPQGVDVELLVTRLTWELNEDGTLKGRPVLVSQSGVTPANQAQAGRHVEQAIRAVQLAAPFDLPPEFYRYWKKLTWDFDRNLS